MFEVKKSKIMTALIKKSLIADFYLNQSNAALLMCRKLHHPVKKKNIEKEMCAFW